ncbi:MAG: hypothetical protein RLZZ210_1529 [Pseudomonadota bacterium]|jgi:hypothetical protein
MTGYTSSATEATFSNEREYYDDNIKTALKNAKAIKKQEESGTESKLETAEKAK